MNLKELRQEIEKLKFLEGEPMNVASHNKLKGIKQAVEAVDEYFRPNSLNILHHNARKDWQKIKELLK